MMNNRFFRWLCLGCLGLGLWGGSVAVRRAVLEQQTRTAGEMEAPFILEAALQHRMTLEVYENGTFRDFDPKVQYPDGVHRWKTYSIGAEFVYAALARLLPDTMSPVSKFRWVSTALFCLAVPFAALWAGLGWRSWTAGIFCGLLLMVSPAFVVRSSGLALSRENLAFPFLCLFLVLEQVSERQKGEGISWMLLAGTALAAGLAQSFWDFSQYFFGLWALAHAAGYFSGRGVTWNAVFVCRAATLGLVVASLLHPYLRGQGFLFSPVMMMMAGGCFFQLDPLRGRTRARFLVIWLIAAGIWMLFGRVFVTNYSHFGELFRAKIVHLNRKPFDPGVLTYSQRIMWTPALNSSTWALTKSFFPSIVITLFPGLVFLLWSLKQSGRPFIRQNVVFLVVTLMMYVLFFRLHVYLILFMAAAAGGMLGALPSLVNRSRAGLAIAVVFGLFITGFEFHRLLFFEPTNKRNESPDQEMMRQALEQMGFAQSREFNRWGHPRHSYQAIAGLVGALRDLDRPDAPVLAGFGISGSILAETDMPILLHPKFESPGIRERVREFYEHLYRKDERALRDWAVSQGAQFYVHTFGALGAAEDPRETPRYMVDAVEPPPEAAARLLEQRSREAVWFQPVWSNDRYQIFRIVTDEDLEFAETLSQLAYEAAARGDPEQARRLAWRVLSDYHWKHQPALDLIGVLGPPRDR